MAVNGAHRLAPRTSWLPAEPPEFPSPTRAAMGSIPRQLPPLDRVRAPMLRPLLQRTLPVLLGILSLACSQEQARGFVVIDPVNADRPLFIDFDKVPEGEVREHTYMLVNTDPRALTIHKLQSSCGCTVPRVTAIHPDGTRTAGKMHGTGDVVSVPVGGQLELTVTTDTHHVRVKNQHKLNTVRLTCDSENEPYLSFEQHLWVVLAFNATPGVIDLELVPENGGRAGSTELFPAQTGSTVRVTGVHSHTDGLGVEFHEESRLAGNITIVTATLPPGLPRGSWIGELRLDTTGDDGTGEGAPFLVKVRGQVTADVVCSPHSLILGNLDPENDATIECVIRALIPGERLMITGHRTEGDADSLAVTYEPDAPGADGRSMRWNVTVKVPAGYTGKSLRGTIEFETDISSAPTVRVPVTGTVVQAR